MNIRLNRLFVRRKELDQVLGTLVQDRILAGEKNREITAGFLKYWECHRGWAFSSSLSAVRYLFRSLGISAGDGVVLTPLAPSYYFEVLSEIGARPLFCDVMKDSPVMDPEGLSSLLAENPRCIILDSSLGALPDFAFFKSLGIFLVEDVSLSLGNFRDLHLAGTIGDVVLYSFLPPSLITCAQGAVLAVRSKRHGEEHFAQEPSKWDLLSDMNAALGLSQWSERENLIEKKKEHYRFLYQRLNRQYKVPKSHGDSEVIPPLFAFLAETGSKEILDYAKKKGVEGALAFSPQVYLNSETEVDFCPNSRYFFQHTLWFPLYANMTAKELEFLGKVLSTLP